MKGLAIILLIPACVLAQPADTLWIRMIGADGSYDAAYDVEATDDGGMLVAGTASTEDNGFFFRVLKFGANGEQEFSRAYGVGEWAECFSIAPTADGGYVLAGSRHIPGANIYVIKVNASGDVDWSYGTIGGEDQTAYSVTEMPDGGYMVAGSYSLSQMQLIRLSATGQPVWTQIYTGAFYVEDIFERPDGTVAVTGWSPGMAGSQFHVAVVDQDGDIVWSDDYGITGYDAYGGADITDDGGLWIVGWSINEQICLVRVAPSGEVLWQHMIDLDRDIHAEALSIMPDSGVVIAGAQPLGGTNSNLWLLRLTSAGDTLWTRSWTFNTDMVMPQAMDVGPIGYAVAGWAMRGGASNYDMFAARVVGDYGRLSGHVLRASSMQPLEGVRVSVSDSVETTTDADGWYLLTLYSGAYTIRYELDGYCRVEEPLEIVAGDYLTRDTVMTQGAASFDVTSITVAGWQDQDVVFHMAHTMGDCRIEYSVSDTSDWITVTPDFGILEPNETQDFHALFRLSELPPGEYLSEIVIRHTAAAIPYRIPVFAYVSLAADEERQPIPQEFGIRSVYPNPFNATATIEYSLQKAANAELHIFDTQGRTVAEPVQGWHAAGVYRVSFDGRALASGVYIAALTADSRRSLHKLMLLK